MKMKPRLRKFETHLPVLRAIPRWMTVKTVVELGGGVGSTPCFRDRSVYKDIGRLITFENDPAWAASLEKGCKAPAEVIRVDWISDAITMLKDWPRQDMLFVDSDPAGSRNLALRELADKFTIIVMHDAEREEYREAQRHFRHRVVYDSLTPHTAVMSNFIALDGLLSRRAA